MPERKTDPPGKSSHHLEDARTNRRLKPDQYELKIRWEKARQVLEVSSSGVRFDFDAPLKVGTKYPVSLTAPGVSFSTTLEVSRCQLTVESPAGRFFRVTGRFFPYTE
ncbi:MAG TPA: hypothetical protein VGK26_11430 [Thermoanaerobaculia bacterium]|jgi:hypothetical protein